MVSYSFIGIGYTSFRQGLHLVLKQMHLMLVVMVCTAVVGLKGNLGTTNTFGCIPKLRLKLSAWQIALEILKISVNGLRFRSGTSYYKGSLVENIIFLTSTQKHIN